MAEAVTAALSDVPGGSPDELRAAVDTLAIVDPLAWGYNDVCATAAQACEMATAATITCPPGGNSPGQLLGELANLVLDGTCTVGILVGSEAVYGRRKAMKENLALDWTPMVGKPDRMKGQRPLSNDLERRHGMFAPVQCYPLYETAIRAASGRSVQEHETFVGTFMARNSAVAAKNPYAWFPTEWTAKQVTTVEADNRMICYPYPKRMNAIMEVDMSAALVVMSNVEADRRGIPRSAQMAFLGGASCVDAWTPTERPSLQSSPAIAAAIAQSLSFANIDINDVDRFDFYSCFPSAVQMGAEAAHVAIDDPRGLSVTGGLAYAGGPGNSYSVHSMATMLGLLRNSADSDQPIHTGLVTSLGMTATKHAVSILSNDPARVGAAEHRYVKVVLEPHHMTGPELVDAPTGEGTIEAYTIEYGRTGEPERTILVIKMDDGTRTVANGTCSADEVRALTDTEGVGRRVRVVGAPQPPDGEERGPNRAELLDTP
jgi:acetyl-CoA C-acetyltransferase